MNPDRNPQAEQMGDESMARNLAWQAQATWPQEQRLFDRYGLQGYECGAGFGPPWFGEKDGLAEGAATTLGIGVVAGFDGDVAAIASARPWPEPVARVAPTTGKTDTPPKKPWYKRAWVWSLIGGLVVAGVVTGAVVGTRQQGGGVAVDSDSFLRPSE